MATFAEAARKLPKNKPYHVVWHGGLVDSLGTRGGLLPEYESSSTWTLTERYLRLRKQCRTLDQLDGVQDGR